MQHPDTSPASPPMVRWLGYGGLIPFLAFAVLTWTNHERWTLWHECLRDYGAVILSFVGALHWGVAMAPGKMSTRERDGMFAWSVVPSLMAFVALIAHSVFGDVLLVLGFLLHYGMDLRIAARAAMPEWYLPLRWRLSVTAVLCLVAGSIWHGTGQIHADRGPNPVASPMDSLFETVGAKTLDGVTPP